MTSVSEYLTDEVVENYANGLIGRREALRQLTLLGVGTAVGVPAHVRVQRRGVGPGRRRPVATRWPPPCALGPGAGGLGGGGGGRWGVGVAAPALARSDPATPHHHRGGGISWLAHPAAI